VRFLPLQRSPAALRCPGLPHPGRSRFSLALTCPRLHQLHSRGSADSCGFPPAFASRSRDLIRRERRPAGRCLWPPRWAANTRLAGWEARPGRACCSTTLLGFMPFAVLILPAGQANVSIRLRPPAVDPNVHPGSAIFFSPGDRSPFLRRAVAWPSRPPEESARNGRSRTSRLGSWVCSGSQAVPRKLSRFTRPILPWALPLAGLRTPAGVRAMPRRSRHAVSPGTRPQTHQRIWRPLSASGSLRS
jgi:hypothetical protein